MSNSQNRLQLGLVLRSAVKRNFHGEQYNVNLVEKLAAKSQHIVRKKKTGANEKKFTNIL